MSSWPDPPGISVQKIASKLGSTSYAEALDFCQTIRRRQILSLGEVKVDDALSTEMDLWSSRIRPEVVNGKRSNDAATKANTGRARKAPSRRTKTRPEARDI
jgi:hypothetical protein